MDQPTSIAAVVVGLAAAIIATAEPPARRTAETADFQPAVSAASAAKPGCVKRAPEPNIAPAAVAPRRPPDVEANSDGINRAGGVGSLPSNPRGDPCASFVLPPRAASDGAASLGR
jgi:hypothetical protein